MKKYKYAGIINGVQIFCKEEDDVNDIRLLDNKSLFEQWEYHQIINSRLYKILKRLWKTR